MNKNKPIAPARDNPEGVINFKVPKGMEPIVEEIRAVRAANFESTSNTSIAKDALKVLHEKVVKDQQ